MYAATRVGNGARGFFAECPVTLRIEVRRRPFTMRALPTFAYIARSADGRRVKGHADAA